MSNVTPIKPASSEEPLTFNRIMIDCGEEAGIEGIEVTGLHKVMWYGGPWDASRDWTDFKHGEPNPLNPSMLIFRIFEDATEIRIYCLQVAEPSKEAGSVAYPPSCYHLQKSARVYTAHSMSFALFKEEIANELQKLAFGDIPPAVDEVTCPSCGVDVPELVHCGACGARLPVEEEEDDDSPVITAGGQTTPSPAPNGSATP